MPLLRPALPTLALYVQSGLTQGTASRLLQVLYVVAAVLAVALIVVVAIAVVAWRKNKDTDLKP